MKKHIPNTVTLLNLTAGSVGVIFLFNGNLTGAASMVFLAAVFDFFDGFLARLLKAYSPIGKSLDSLADVVSFGLLPGLLVYYNAKATWRIRFLRRPGICFQWFNHPGTVSASTGYI